jgi:Photoprotection regulator fluorescence recovery protein
MPSPRRFTTNDYSRELKWPHSEKKIAQKIFQDALQRELDGVTKEAKKRMANMKEPSDLWDLEAFLTRRRNEIDAQFDFRYSVLPMVFASLLQKRKISERELEGLGEEKIEFVRSMAKVR